jgi:hypothetical protein
VAATITGSKIGVRSIKRTLALPPAKDNLIVDSQIVNSDSLDILVSGGSTLIVSNTGFDTSKVLVEDDSYLGVGWHLNILVTDGSTPVEGAIVKVSSALFPSVAVEGVTNAEGRVFLNVPEYVMLATGVLQTPQYAVEVSKENFTVFTGDVTVTKNTEYSTIITGVGDASESLPDQFELQQNYPNPFNPETKINYQLPKNANVSLKIYNMLGQLVIKLVDERQSAGFKSVSWNGKDRFGNQVGNGIYIYVIKAGDFRDVKRMVLLK